MINQDYRLYFNFCTWKQNESHKTLGYSKLVEIHRAVAAWEDIIYNLVRALKNVTPGGLRCSDSPLGSLTPAMAWADGSSLDG